MKLPKSRKTSALFMLGCMLLAGLVPLAQSNHYNGFLANPFQGGSGQGNLDTALTTLGGLLGQAPNTYASLVGPNVQEPQVPATFFVDSFEDGRRIGGYGDWIDGGASLAGWRRTMAAATEGDLGYHWVDTTDGFYPTSTGRVATHSYLVSPKINLQSLPVADDTTGQKLVGIDLAGQPTQAVQNGVAPLIALTFTHRYHFASTGTDGGRLEVFTQEPTPARLLTGGIVVQSVNFDSTNPPGPTAAFGDQAPAFMKWSANSLQPAQVVYDLEPFAGQDVWLVFHAASSQQLNRQGYFGSPVYFNPQAGFYGWMIDNLHIEGVAYPHNIILAEVPVPGFIDSQDETPRVMSGSDGEPIQVLAINRGQYSETVTAELQLARVSSPQTTLQCAPTESSYRIRPGEAVRIGFECRDPARPLDVGGLENGHEYQATALLKLQSGVQDAREVDNRQVIRFRAERGTDIEATPPVLEPRLGLTTDLRTLTIPLVNHGYGRETVNLTLQVLLQKVPGASGPEFSDVTEAATGGHTQVVKVVEADPVGRANKATAVWPEILLSEPGEYRLIVNGSVGGPDKCGDRLGACFSVRAAAGSLFTKGKAYFDSFNGSGSLDLSLVHPARPTWHNESLGNEDPPKNPDGTSPTYVWELPGRVDTTPVAQNIVRRFLRGEADLSELAANEPITRLEVDYVHYFQNMRCGSTRLVGTTGTPECFLPNMELASVRLTGPEEDPFFTGDSQVSPGFTTVSVGAAVEGHRRLLEHPLQFIHWSGFNGGAVFAQSNPQNRLTYYANQWIPEAYSIPLATSPEGSVPAAALTGLNLEFMFGNAAEAGTQFGAAANSALVCPRYTASPLQALCPDWRVSFMEVRAVKADGTKVTLLRMDGGAHPETGTFRSSYVSGTTDPTNSMQSCGAPPEALLDETHGRCPSWRKLYTAGLEAPSLPSLQNLRATPSTDGWRLETGNFPASLVEGQGVWHHGNKTQAVTYSDGVAGKGVTSMLVSPAFVIREDLPDPVLQFQHKFNFQVATTAGYTVTNPGMLDGGTLMVRFLAENGTGGLEPTSPFLPVLTDPAWRYEASEVPFTPSLPKDLVRSAHRFTGNDCDYYNDDDDDDGISGDPGSSEAQENAAAQGACKSLGLVDRLMNTQSVSLKQFAVFDYRTIHFVGDNYVDDLGANPTNPSNPPNLFCATVPAFGVGPCFDTGLMPTRSQATNPFAAPNTLRDPDFYALSRVEENGAMRLMDLRRDCGGPCIVEFGFRLDIAPSELLPLPGALSITKNHDAASANQALPSGGGEGWFIGGISILAENKLAHNLRVLDKESPPTLETGYDWQKLNLGPQTPATLTVGVRNDGLFTESKVKAEVQYRNIVTGVITTLPFELPGFTIRPAIDSSDFERLSLNFILPSQAGDYQFLARVWIEEALSSGLVIVDNDPSDNCVVLNAVDGTTVCDLVNAPLLQVQSNPRLEIDLRVTPNVGLANFPRTVALTLNNTGNVVVKNATLSLQVNRIGDTTGSTQDFKWVIAASPPPNTAAPWETLTLLDEDGHTKRPLGSLTLVRPGEAGGRFFITARLEAPNVFVTDRVLADAFATVYSDNFEPGGLSQASGIVDGTLQPDDANWTQVKGLNHGETGKQAWLFGDSKSGRFEPGADSSLNLPTLDLTGLSQASLSFSHRYAFEGGYDGGRVEARVPGGEWLVLEPTEAYPARMLASSPLNPSGDPRATVLAFSGTTMPADAKPDEGWVINEFNLGQMPGFTTQVQLAKLDPPPIKTGDDQVVRYVENDQVSFLNPSWRLPFQTECPPDCWYSENLNHHNPRKDPAADPDLAAPPQRPPIPSSDARVTDPYFWWSGSFGPKPYYLDGTALSLTVQVPVLDDGERASLSFWVWRDAGSYVRVDRPNDQQLGIIIDFTDLLPVGWSRQNYNLLPSDSGRNVTFQFAYHDWTSNGGTYKGAFSNRGVVIDDVALEFYTAGAGGTRIPTNRADSGTMPILSESFGPVTACWNGPQADHQLPDMCFRKVPRAAAAPEAWQVLSKETHTQREGNVWWFGINPATPGGKYTFPPNAHERLVTPFLSLESVGGAAASLRYFERYDIDGGDARRVLIQPMVAGLGGDEPGDWEQLNETLEKGGNEGNFDFTTHNRRKSSSDCGGKDWCERELDVSNYIGTRVRFAFEVETNREDTAFLSGDPSPGYHWAIDDIKLFGDTLAGGPLQIRLRAAVDDSIQEGSWAVDNLQVVGRFYGRDLTVLPEDPSPRVIVAPGSILSLKGEVRNLAPNPERDLFLRVDIQPLRPADPAFDSSKINFTLPKIENATRVGPFGLQPGGSTAYNINVPVEGSPGSEYVLSLKLLQEDQFGEVAPLVDDNLGDHERTLALRVEEVRQVVASGDLISPRVTKTGDPVELGLNLKNDGNLPANVTVAFSVVDYGSQAAKFVPQPPQTLTLNPGQNGTVGVKWPAASGSDLLVAKALITGMSSSGAPILTEDRTLGHLLVDRDPVFFRDGFEGQPDGRGWTSQAATHSSTVCGVQSSQLDSSPQSNGMWQLATGDSYEGTQSYRLGPSPQQAILGATYLPNRDELLRSPPIDLSELEGLTRMPSDPLIPNLHFQYRGLLGSNDGMIVQAFPAGMVPTSLDDENEAGFLTCRNPLLYNDVQVTGENPRPALAQPSESWRSAQYDLAGLMGSPPFYLMGQKSAQFQFRFASDGVSEASGMVVDSVTISAYKVGVEPPEQAAVLRNGADKIFRFVVTNLGAVTDNYTVGIDPTYGELPASVKVTVLTPYLNLLAGQSAMAEIALQVDDSVQAGFARRSLALVAASQLDPGRVASAVLTIDQLQITRLPDLDMRLSRPAGEPGTLNVGSATTFLAAMRNSGGGQSRATTMAILACRDLGDDFESMQICVDALGTKTKADDPVLVTPTPLTVPSLATNVQITQPVTWIPPVSFTPGDYLIVGIVDLAGVNRQLQHGNDFFALPIKILPLQKPDLQVVALRILGDSGPTALAFAGQTLRFEADFQNIGNTEARDVQLRISNRFPLIEQHVPVMQPGQTITLSAQAVAEAGTFVVVADASTPDPESSTTNNALKKPLAVQRGTLLMSFEVERIVLPRGTDIEAILRLQSLRDGDLPVRLQVDAPSDFDVGGVPANAVLPRGIPQQVLVGIRASPLADEGPRSITVRAFSATGHVLAQAELVVEIPAETALIAYGDPMLAPPGRLDLPARILNRGDSAASLDLSVEFPPNWSGFVTPGQGQLQPGETLDVVVSVVSPGNAPPGAYQATLVDHGTAIGQLDMVLTTTPAWVWETAGVTESGGFRNVLLRVTNVGNAAAIPSLDESGQTAIPVAVNPIPQSLQPGASQSFQVRYIAGAAVIGAPDDLAVTDGQNATALNSLGPVPSVRTTGWTLAPPKIVASGDRIDAAVTVENPTSSPLLGIPIRVFVDGLLADERRVDLAAGETREVRLAWTAMEGAHVVAMSVGDGESTTLRSEIVNAHANANETGVPTIGFSVLIPLLAALACLRRRRQ